MFPLWNIGGLPYKFFSVFTVYLCTNLELHFSVKGYRNTQVVGKVCFIYVYAFATSMISFETNLATLPMETNVAFCARISCIFFCALYVDLGLLQVQGSGLLHQIVHLVVVQQQHYFLFLDVDFRVGTASLAY